MQWSTLLIVHPWLCFIPAALLIWLWRASRSRVALVASLLWLAYTAWEYSIKIASPDADIRVDLLLIYPLLLVATLAAMWFGLRKGST